MNVLVLNCGSSSVKYQVLAVAGPARPARLTAGEIQRVGESGTGDHGAAVRRVVDDVAALGLRVDAVGHRVVHGGARFTGPTRLTDALVADLDRLAALAPLHNTPAVAGMRAARAALGPAVPMVAVFDTAFHATLPAAAAGYALPESLAHRHGIRRYGFHGTSYRSVVGRYAELTGTPVEAASLVALHLGNGCSAAAIRDGRSVDTSMGFTPLEGLVMGTRAGDLDPAIVAHLARVEGVSADEVERWLNERSGLLGVSGTSRDMRDLLAREDTDARARLAIEMFCHRARKYLGAYLAVLGGAAAAVVFTGGIGEHAAPVRARICADMAWGGLVLDPARNAAAAGEARIDGAGSRLAAFVIPTDEEAVIARDTADCLAGASAS
jgi:acetate kinase